MKSVVVALVGTVAILGATTAGLAQEPDKKKEQRPAAQPKRAAPQPKAAQPQRAAPQPRAAQPQVQRPAARPPTQGPAAVERARPQRPAAVPRAERRAAEERRDGAERRPERNRAEQLQRSEQSRSRQERAERERAERNRRAHEREQAQQRREQQKARQGEARSPAPSIAPKQVEKEARQPDAADKDAGRQAQPVARTQATDQQRREVRQRLFRERNVQRVSRQRLGAPIAVGSHVPRRHRLHRFTPALLAFAPFYASYSYLVVDDMICVVDPETYVIVDVIPASIERASPGPEAQPALALSREQMRFILANVPKDRARTGLRIRLALGAEIPRSVELFRFPEAVLARVPQVAPFRYIVVGDDVVIVDPRDYEIALVITE